MDPGYISPAWVFTATPAAPGVGGLKCVCSAWLRVIMAELDSGKARDQSDLDGGAGARTLLRCDGGDGTTWGRARGLV